MPTPLPSSSAWLAFADAARHSSRRGARLRVIEAAGLRVDLTAQAHSDDLDSAAEDLLAQQDFDNARAQLFDGGPANWTEHRPAWHTALRAARPPTPVAGAILGERDRLRRFVQDADMRGAYRHVLHLGIGGSDWGPRMVTRALRHNGLKREVRFASNVDSHAVADALHHLDPHDTLIIVASKSFTTTEPLANAEVAMNWLRNAGVADPVRQVVAITANVDAALDFGISPQHIFRFWDWVGGRYSLWSAIGLPVALALGCDALDELLAGAAAMDQHFLHTPMRRNAPLQMALAGVANRSVLGYGSLAITPYDSRLTHLVPWAQQLEMESLGKVAGHDGSPAGVPTGPVVWGMTGTDCQHTFFQWLHQDTAGAPVDFIVCEQADHPYDHFHKLLIANCLAQRAALLRGKPFDEALKEARLVESDPQQAEILAHHRVHPGGRPSTLIMLPRLSARALGALLAMYEHKVFAQGVLWGINPFDQWGVEYGKALARNIIRELENPSSEVNQQDPSTRYWIDALRKQP
ncbi:glucose-6-phosphate isomerase [Bordetella pertussis]|uniref:glucose-6-phosphate isomerase n=1 Tax=Bordetella pertussis TaxID=520 RepID=UPI000E19C9B1|nr:glucose-6-phosphate isomerase [Bordetella pertussis]SUV77820.1 glucose-6-phosphate isomerase [Bordetella pertussis]